MPWIKLQDGTVAHLLMRRRRKADLCSVCHRFLRDALCDYRDPATNRLCSAPLCKHCAVHVEPDLDYCPHHSYLPPQQAFTFGEAA